MNKQIRVNKEWKKMQIKKNGYEKDKTMLGIVVF